MEKITLKKLIDHKNKSVVIPLFTGIFMALYGLSGAISYQTGIFLPMSELEKNIPLLPWTIWIYIVLYPGYLIWCIFGYKNEIYMNKTMYSFLILTFISCLIFIIFPVNYPRAFYPLPLGDDITTLIFRAVRAIDKPSNCLPSLHVGLCYCFTYGWLRENKMKFYISMIISTAIAISTLTTKQHYSYDIITGFIISYSLFIFFDKFSEVKTVSKDQKLQESNQITD